MEITYTKQGGYLLPNLTLKERLFCVIAYLPKATVQSAKASVPLQMVLQVER